MIQLFKDQKGNYNFNPAGKLSGRDYVLNELRQTPPGDRQGVYMLFVSETRGDLLHSIQRYKSEVVNLVSGGAFGDDLPSTNSENNIKELGNFLVFLICRVSKAFNLTLNEEFINDELKIIPTHLDKDPFCEVSNGALRQYLSALEQARTLCVLCKQPWKPAAKRGHKKRTGNFRALIQYGNCESDKDKLLKRLHYLIDGKSGADVGSVLLNVWYIKGYLAKKPGKGDYESEFGPIDTNKWKAIAKYLDEGSENAISRANQIILFS